ncbi:MAG TPA: NAD-dependent epimerase/dehydratase family protein [Promineifilum sp.]|nr:NAD-dependent epimerase/dehydratase family protein [Promineifilum sp.]
MKAVLTGATGFIGGAVARRLAAEGVAVHALTRPGADRTRLAGLPVVFHDGDFTDPAGLVGLFDGATWVIHAAGMLGRAGVSEAEYRRVNAEGARAFLAAAAEAYRAGRTAADLRVLHVSTAGVLGARMKDEGGGMKDEGGGMNPGTPAPDSAFILQPSSFETLAPSNAYERSKALAEGYAAALAAAGLPLVIARPEFIYGPSDLHVLGLFRAIQRGQFFYIGDGNNTCHPTYVDDLVDGLLACLRAGAPGGVYTIAGPRTLTFRELAETIAAELGVRPPRWRVPRRLAWLGAAGLEGVGRLTGRGVPLSRDGVAFFSESRGSSIARARAELGYAPRVDLREGVARTVGWYRGEGLL